MMNCLNIWIVIIISWAVSVNQSILIDWAMNFLFESLAHSGVFVARIFYLIIELSIEIPLIWTVAPLFNVGRINIDLEFLTERIIEVSFDFHNLFLFFIASALIVAISTILLIIISLCWRIQLLLGRILMNLRCSIVLIINRKKIILLRVVLIWFKSNEMIAGMMLLLMNMRENSSIIIGAPLMMWRHHDILYSVSVLLLIFSTSISALCCLFCLLNEFII